MESHVWKRTQTKEPIVKCLTFPRSSHLFFAIWTWKRAHNGLLCARTSCTWGPWCCQWTFRLTSSLCDLIQGWFPALFVLVHALWKARNRQTELGSRGYVSKSKIKRTSPCFPTALQGKVFHLSRGGCAQHHQQIRLSAGQLQMGQTQIQLWQPWTGLVSPTFLFYESYSVNIAHLF